MRFIELLLSGHVSALRGMRLDGCNQREGPRRAGSQASFPENPPLEPDYD